MEVDLRVGCEISPEFAGAVLQAGRASLWRIHESCCTNDHPSRDYVYYRGMRLVEEIDVINSGTAKSQAEVALQAIRKAIHGVVWPPKTKQFTIYPESGKKTGQGNGVGPIKAAFIAQLLKAGWHREFPFPIKGVSGGSQFGAIDASTETNNGIVAVEWETGNISSSHRSMNKLTLGLRKGGLLAGILIVPTRDLAQYLTDRIGNVYELRSYVDLWASVKVKNGYLGIFAVEHDKLSLSVPRILKGTDGRALL